MSNETETKPAIQPLTREFFAQIVQSYHRLIGLMNATIKQPNDDAEITGLRTFLARAFLTHGAEFLNAWLIVADEYTPLVNSFASLQQRAGNYLAMRQAQFNAAQAAAQQPVTGDGEEGKIIDVEFSGAGREHGD